MAVAQTYSCFVETPLGKALVSANDNAITGFWFVGQKYYPKNTEAWVQDSDYPVFKLLRVWLTRYFAAENPTLDFKLAPQGTPFQQAVWKILLAIPQGQLSSYGEIARQLANQMNRESMSAQAVGGAVGHNPISLIIPCHRVVGGNGSLTGYAGGIDKKQALLRLEKALLL